MRRWLWVLAAVSAFTVGLAYAVSSVETCPLAGTDACPLVR